MSRSDSVHIPKRIIQTAKERTLTLKQRAFVANVRLLHPDFEWCFFDDADVQAFVDKEFPAFRRTFAAYPSHIQRVDFFRYLAVYRLGGFYFDLDVLLARDLSPLLPLGCVFPFEGLTFSTLLRTYGMTWEIGNYAFGASAGHPFLQAAIENCVRSQREPDWVATMLRGVPPLSRRDHSVLYSTGPGLLSRTFAENPAFAAQVTVLFPEDVCDVESWNRFGEFGIHAMEGTWRHKRSFIRRRIAQRWEVWRMGRLIRQTSRHGPPAALSLPAAHGPVDKTVDRMVTGQVKQI